MIPLLFKLRCKINTDLRQLVEEVWEKFFLMIIRNRTTKF